MELIDYSNFKAEDFLLDDRFIDYCKNKAEQNIFREALLKKNPGIEMEMNKAFSLFEILSLKTTPEEKEWELSKLKAVLSSSENNNNSSFPSKTNFYRIRNFVAAAVILGIIAAGSIWYNFTIPHQSQLQAYSLYQFKTFISSNYDERKEIVLPDGSNVLLNYGSIIKIEENYNKQDRRVFLEGEALFTIQHDTKRPFTVLTNHSQTTALGTSFKVKDYPGEDLSSVMLASGKVKVISITKQKKPEEFTLIPGDQVTIHEAGNNLSGSFSLQDLTDWENIQINFDRADLSEIIREIEFYYGVKIKLKNEPKNHIFLTGKFYNKPLKDVLEAISYTNKLAWTQKQNSIYIDFNSDLK